MKIFIITLSSLATLIILTLIFFKIKFYIDSRNTRRLIQKLESIKTADVFMNRYQKEYNRYEKK